VYIALIIVFYLCFIACIARIFFIFSESGVFS